MKFSEYQKRTEATDLYPPNIPEMDGDDMRVMLLEYRTLCLCGEVGELSEKVLALVLSSLGLSSKSGTLANKVKKVRRDGDGVIDDIAREKISHEIGDILWYLARICEVASLDMDKVAENNLTMLLKRQKENKIHGEGDNR